MLLRGARCAPWRVGTQEALWQGAANAWPWGRPAPERPFEIGTKVAVMTKGYNPVQVRIRDSPQATALLGAAWSADYHMGRVTEYRPDTDEYEVTSAPGSIPEQVVVPQEDVVLRADRRRTLLKAVVAGVLLAQVGGAAVLFYRGYTAKGTELQKYRSKHVAYYGLVSYGLLAMVFVTPLGMALATFGNASPLNAFGGSAAVSLLLLDDLFSE